MLLIAQARDPLWLQMVRWRRPPITLPSFNRSGARPPLATRFLLRASSEAQIFHFNRSGARSPVATRREDRSSGHTVASIAQARTDLVPPSKRVSLGRPLSTCNRSNTRSTAATSAKCGQQVICFQSLKRVRLFGYEHEVNASDDDHECLSIAQARPALWLPNRISRTGQASFLACNRSVASRLLQHFPGDAGDWSEHLLSFNRLIAWLPFDHAKGRACPIPIAVFCPTPA